MPGRLRRVDPDATGARLVFEHAELEIRFLASDVVRLSWGPGTSARSLCSRRRACRGRHPPSRRAPSPTVASLLRSSELTVSVDGEGSVRMLRPDGTVLRTEAPPVRRGAGWELRHGMRPGERFGGLGEQSAGVDLRGGRFDAVEHRRRWFMGFGTGSAVPGDPRRRRDPSATGDTLTFYENSTRGRLLLRRGHRRARRDAGREAADRRRAAGTATVGFAGGVLRHYVMAGDGSAPPRPLFRAHRAPGAPAPVGARLPPEPVGIQDRARMSARSSTATGLSVVPLSAVHLDIDYMDGYRVFTFDRTRFPTRRHWRPSWRASGVRLVTIVDPGVKVDPDYAVYRQGLEDGRFCVDETGRRVEGVVWPGRVAFPDFTDPGTRTWWAGQYRVLTDAGIAGIWHDMNEPTSISLLGDPSLPLPPVTTSTGAAAITREGHNLYGLLMNRAGYEGLSWLPSRATTVHRVALGVGRDAALGMELDRRRGQHLGLDASTDGDGDRSRLVGCALFGSRHRRVQRGARRRALRAVAADERAPALLPHPLGTRRAPA